MIDSDLGIKGDKIGSAAGEVWLRISSLLAQIPLEIWPSIKTTQSSSLKIMTLQVPGEFQAKNMSN